MTASVWIDEGDDGGQTDDGPLVALLCCLLREGVLGDRALRSLEAAGVDVEQLLRCLHGICGEQKRELR